MSNNTNQTTLFGQFAPATKESWKSQIIRDLKAASEAEQQAMYQNQMIWRTYEGIEVQLFYTSEDTRSFPFVSISCRSNISWQNREEIKVSEHITAAQVATEALQQGVDALSFDFTKTEVTGLDLSKLLSYASKLPTSLKLRNKPTFFIEALQANVPTNWQGTLNYDPIGYALQGDNLPNDAFDILGRVVEHTKAFPDFGALTVNSHHFHDAGASAVQELAFTLPSLVEYLDQLSERGSSIDAIFNSCELSLSVSTNYFMEIAKLRALRLLARQLAEAFGIKSEQATVKIHARTAQWNKFEQDAYNNMLRATIESMAAVLGGCDALTVMPYNMFAVENDSFAHRIACNVSTILKEESYFDKIIDAASGTYYLESLTYSIAKESWNLFKQVEAQGGLLKAFAQGFIQDELEKVRHSKEKAIKEGKQVLVGINKYIPKGSSILEKEIFTPLRKATT